MTRTHPKVLAMARQMASDEYSALACPILAKEALEGKMDDYIGLRLTIKAIERVVEDISFAASLSAPEWKEQGSPIGALALNAFAREIKAFEHLPEPERKTSHGEHHLQHIQMV